VLPPALRVDWMRGKKDLDSILAYGSTKLELSGRWFSETARGTGFLAFLLELTKTVSAHFNKGTYECQRRRTFDL